MFMKRPPGHSWLALPRGGSPPPLPAAAPGPRLRSAEVLFNRDLSWLNFNDRVLAEAADPAVPLLERLRFATIVSSNLDEFFMVRVAEIARLAKRSPSRRYPDGLTPARLLAQVREHALRQKSRQAGVLEEILAALARHGIRIYTEFEGRGAMDAGMRRHLPPIRYVLRRSTEPPPPLESERIHVFVRFPAEYAVLAIQRREERLIELPPAGRTRRFALVDRWLSDRARVLFPGREVIEAFPFKIIRDADLRYRPDDEETLEEQIVQAVHRRSKARVVRLEVDAPAYTEEALFLASALGVDPAALYRFDLPLDLRTLAPLYRLKAPAKLRYPPVRPQIPPPLRKFATIFDRIRKRPLLLHHPYDSFRAVEAFLYRAARDPMVTRIYHTVYRTSADSPVLGALKAAARRGKQVTAYVEIKARFDELRNVRWAEDLRRAGVRIVRPLGRFKVHSKITQVFRREGGREASYLHLGTGNYHPGTARQYTDLGLLTADETLGRDAALYFRALARREAAPAFEEFLASPVNLHAHVLRLIRTETFIQRRGGRGHIMAKMNSLADPEIIAALYEASAAGVRIELQVRGICCLRPGIAGLSENIRVVSVVDRYLEHSRIYYFRAGGSRRIYLSSADWMPRNFFQRWEVAFPVKDPDLKRYVRNVILETGMNDNAKAWELRPDGTYARMKAPKGAKPVRSQFVFEALARRRYRGTALERRA